MLKYSSYGSRFLMSRLFLCMLLAWSANSIVSAQGFQSLQNYTESSDDYTPGDIVLSAFGGAGILYGDIPDGEYHFSAGGEIFITALEHLQLGLQIQKGSLKGGAIQKVTSNLAGFDCSYLSGALLARVFPMKLLQEEHPFIQAASGLYFGTGLGFVAYHTKMNFKDLEALGPYFMQNRLDFLYPVQTGFLFPLAEWKEKYRVLVSINYSVWFSTTDKLDGYVPPGSKKNDNFHSFSVGLGVRLR